MHAYNISYNSNIMCSSQITSIEISLVYILYLLVLLI